MKEQIEEMRNIMETDCDRPCAGCELENEEHCFTHNCAIRIYNAGYRKQEWISVDERLPEKSGDYLTFHEHGSCGTIYYNAAIKLWNVYYVDDTRSAIRSITHWMPLPEAPKMKGGE